MQGLPRSVLHTFHSPSKWEAVRVTTNFHGHKCLGETALYVPRQSNKEGLIVW